MTKSPNRLIAIAFGLVYVLVGLLGFTATGDVPSFFSTEGGLLLGIFEVNIFHNVAHLLIGAGLLIAGMSGISAAKGVNIFVGAAYLLLGLAGLFLVGTAANVLAINAADNVLHFASAAVLLLVGIGADKASSPRTA